MFGWCSTPCLLEIYWIYMYYWVIMFLLGAKPLGPRGPRALFYMLPKHYRVQGLCTALSFKYAQNNLHIVDSLEIPTDDPEVENN